MELWLRIYKHLLPRARAWSITVEKKLRQFFEGLTGLPEDARNYLAGVLLDVFPTTTTALDEWAEQFNFVRTGNDAVDRQTLQGAWILNEYQSPKQIQDTLQAAGFNVYVHEWWQTPVVGSPEPKTPFFYLGNTALLPNTFAGSEQMFAGEAEAVAGYLEQQVLPTLLTGLDNLDMFLDNENAYLDNFFIAEGYALVNKIGILGYSYQIPNEPEYWPYFLYIGGENFPDVADIPAARKNEFETLCLKICPAEQWLGILVNYI